MKSYGFQAAPYLSQLVPDYISWNIKRFSYLFKNHQSSSVFGILIYLFKCFILPNGSSLRTYILSQLRKKIEVQVLQSLQVFFILSVLKVLLVYIHYVSLSLIKLKSVRPYWTLCILWISSDHGCEVFKDYLTLFLVFSRSFQQQEVFLNSQSELNWFLWFGENWFHAQRALELFYADKKSFTIWM